MASSSDPFSQNVIGVTDLVQNPTNKVNAGSAESPEGYIGEKYNALSLDMKDEQLLKLRNEWEKKYAPYESKIKQIVQKNKESYLGKDANGQWLAGEDTIVANLQFEAEETFLPAALSKNPEPVVFADNSPEGNKLADGVQTMLTFHAIQLKLRRKLSIMVRQWSVNHLGVLKFGWNERINDVAIENRKIQDFVFDPEGFVDAFGDFHGYLGERIKLTAEKLIELYPDHEQYISDTVEGRLGTETIHTEWWSADDSYTFVTYKDRVLDKHKNEYFKYPDLMIDAMDNPILDEYGQEQMSEPRNHFAYPKKPYTFLSVFSFQEQPHDVTGLIEQNIPNQKRIHRQTEQIDYNIAASNNGYAYSEDNFTQETAKQAANARKMGNPILIPQGGDIDKAIKALPAQDLPQGFFASLENHKNDLRTSWGVQGITAEPHDEDQTARGMILNQAHDTTRIGGGIGDAVEGAAEAEFNWLTQLYYVFYDEKHFAAIMGSAKAVEYVTLSNAQFDRQLIVTVSPDSMKPKDQITEINMAQALYDKGAIGPKTLLKMVDFPDPDAAAADGALWTADKMAYMQINFPEVFQQMQQIQQQMAMEQMQMQAQGAGMTAAAEAGAMPPEAITEPPQDINRDPASAALSNVQLPPIPETAQ